MKNVPFYLVMGATLPIMLVWFSACISAGVILGIYDRIKS